MDFKKEINNLFDGEYHPEKNCFFCEELCQNECARTLIENTINPSLLFRPENLNDVKIATSSFIDLINEREQYGFFPKLYIIFSFISWMSRYEIMHYFLMLQPSTIRGIANHLKRIQKEYTELDEHKKLNADALFQCKLEHIISFLEREGEELKEPF